MRFFFSTTLLHERLLHVITKIVCYFLIKEEKNDMMFNSGFFNRRKAKNVVTVLIEICIYSMFCKKMKKLPSVMEQKEKEIVRWQK